MNLILLFQIIKYLSITSVFLPLFFFRQKHFKSVVLSILFVYIIISVSTELFNLFIVSNGTHNYFVRNIYTVIEFICFSVIYFNKVNSLIVKLLIKLLFLIFIALTVYLLLIEKGLNQADNVLSTFESAFFITLCYAFIFNIISRVNLAEMNEGSFVWINFGVLVYFSATFILFLFNNLIEKFPIEYYYILHSFHLLANIAFNIMLSVGIWKAKQKYSST